MTRENGPNHAPLRTWLITGASSGLGHALAECVLSHGDQVVLTAPTLSGMEALAARYPCSALALELDVTDPLQRIDAVDRALAHFGAIDVLVNNAAIDFLGAVEEQREDDYRAQFEVNFFGAVGMIRLVLPGMRKRRSGHIVNFSSIGGLVSFPAVGYYNATKYAVEGLSEALAQEVDPLGIKVTIVEPGPFRTDWAGRSLRESKVAIDDYSATAGQRRKQTHGISGKQQGDPVRAGEAIIKAVTSDDPPLRLVLGKPALDEAYQKLRDMKTNFDAWRQTSLSADYPEAQSTKRELHTATASPSKRSHAAR